MSTVNLSAGDIYVPVKIEDNFNESLLYLLSVIRPDWSPENINFQIFTDGITNRLIACKYSSEKADENNIVLVRIYGNKTELFIDRKAELRNIRALNKSALAPLVYGVFENGLAYQYYPGSALTTSTVICPKIWPLVARQLARMHKATVETEVSKEPFVWERTEQFLSLLPEPFTDSEKQIRFAKSFGSVTKLRIEYERLKTHLSKTKSPIVFGHNDLLLGNVIYNEEEGTVSFIDFEYAAYNYQAFDIANHFNEFVGISLEEIDYTKFPNKEFQKAWIKTYLGEYHRLDSVTESMVEEVQCQVEQMVIASHFLWGIWALVQAEHSKIDFQFLEYSELRLSKYYELKGDVYKQFN